MTVVARRRLAWRGARRSLSFVIGLALLATAASGRPARAPGDARVGAERAGVTAVAAARPARSAAATPGAARGAVKPGPARSSSVARAAGPGPAGAASAPLAVGLPAGTALAPAERAAARPVPAGTPAGRSGPAARGPRAPPRAA
jgi:hypothetical protein